MKQDIVTMTFLPLWQLCTTEYALLVQREHILYDLKHTQQSQTVGKMFLVKSKIEKAEAVGMLLHT